MDEPERDHLRQHIRELQQANRRWKALAIICVGVVALVFLAGGATVLSGGLLMSHRMQLDAMRAREAEMDARMQAEEAQLQAERARTEAQLQAERARQAEIEARKEAEEAIRDGKR